MSDFTFPCPVCGQLIRCDIGSAGRSTICPVCRNTVGVPQASGSAPAPFPIGVQPAPAGTSGLAVASFICSIFLCIGCIPGIICGHLARRNLRRDAALGGGGLAIAGLIISYLSLAASLGVTLLAIVFFQDFKDAVQEAMQMDRSVSVNQSAATDETSDTKATLLWKLDLSAEDFPEQPAAGKVHGFEFVAGNVSVQNGVITFHQSGGHHPAQVVIFTFLKNGESLAGKSWDISVGVPDDPDSTKPRVNLRWKNGKNFKSSAYADGYALKLEFTDAQPDGEIPGNIYLCLPDDERSYVAGSFTLKPAKPPAKKQKAKNPAN